MTRLKRYGRRIGQARKIMRSFMSEASDAYHFWCFHLECRFVQTWPIRVIAWLNSMRVPRSAGFGPFERNSTVNSNDKPTREGP